jgi:hypothetical protein
MQHMSQKHRLFVEAYDGDEVYAMRVAGFTGDDRYLASKASELLTTPLIQEAIKNRARFTANTKKAIADREERQALWTAIMRNEDPHHRSEVDPVTNAPISQGNIPIPVRLKATELLGKSEADFVDKIDMNVNHSLSDLILESYKLPAAEDMSVEAIEAEYFKAKELRPLPPPSSVEDFI